MELDRRDLITMEHAPVVAVPRYTNFPPLQQPGHRFLLADNGLWIEVKRAWLSLLAPIGPAAIRLPYGELMAVGHSFAFSNENLAFILAQFQFDALAALPNEFAAWGIWDETAKTLRYQPCIAIESGPAGIEFHRPNLALHEHFAVDIHSHGTGPAFFSATDDADDRGEIKLSIVVGALEEEPPEIAMRLCALGLFIDLEESACS